MVPPPMSIARIRPSPITGCYGGTRSAPARQRQEGRGGRQSERRAHEGRGQGQGGGREGGWRSLNGDRRQGRSAQGQCPVEVRRHRARRGARSANGRAGLAVVRTDLSG